MEAPADNRHFALGSPHAAEATASAATPLRLSQPVVGNTRVPALAAFAHGFLGGLVGGIAYQFAPSWLQLRELPFAGVSILVLATILGAFEVWRVAQVRTIKLVRMRMLFVLLACLVVLLTVAGFTSALTPSSPEEPAPVPMAPRKAVIC